MLRSVVFLLMIAFIASCGNRADFELQEGDILFQDLDCGVYCESIESVTRGYKGANLSHCGIVTYQNDSAFVLEAISKGVSMTPLSDFLSRSSDDEGNPKVLVGRMNDARIQANASFLAKRKLGKPYDGVYNIQDDSYYCSELLYFSYLKNEQPIFLLRPMTFKAADSDSTFADWIDYFQDMGLEVPEGEPGLNPGGISLSEHLNIVHQYGQPNGMR